MCFGEARLMAGVEGGPQNALPSKDGPDRYAAFATRQRGSWLDHTTPGVVQMNARDSHK